MKKRMISILFCVIALVPALTLPAFADTGPKPSVVVTFDGLAGETYYGTLLSETNSTGPYSAPDAYGETYYVPEDPEYPIHQKFVQYLDKDGFYYLQFLQELSQSHQLDWSYYPPSSFKILLYFPAHDCFAVSDDVYTRYAFDSYYTVDASALSPLPAPSGETTVITGLTAVESYAYGKELAALLARILLTICIELVLALLFGYRGKKALLFLGGVNIVTQTLLNVLLNLLQYHHGPWAFVFAYLLLEILVFAIEALLYAAILPRRQGGKKSRAVVYALAANAASFAAGLWLANYLSAIF